MNAPETSVRLRGSCFSPKGFVSVPRKVTRSSSCHPIKEQFFSFKVTKLRCESQKLFGFLMLHSPMTGHAGTVMLSFEGDGFQQLSYKPTISPCFNQIADILSMCVAQHLLIHRSVLIGWFDFEPTGVQRDPHGNWIPSHGNIVKVVQLDQRTVVEASSH